MIAPRPSPASVALLAFVTWAAGASPCLAQGAFPDPPRIVHTLTPEDGQESWLVETRLGGDEPRRLFAVPHVRGGAPIPVLSPDGRFVAYTTVNDITRGRLHADLVVVDLLGGASRTLSRVVLHARPVFDRFGIELYAVRIRHRVPPRPSRPEGPIYHPPSVWRLVALSSADGTERDLAVESTSRLEVIGVSRHGEVIVVREDARDGAILALDPQTGATRVVLPLGSAATTDVSLSPLDDRLLLARSVGASRRRWEIVLCELDGRARVLRRERRGDLRPFRVGGSVMFAGRRGGPLRVIDLEGHELPRTQTRESTTRHRVIAATPDGRITVMRRDTPEGYGFVALDREAAFAVPLTDGGVVVDVAGFR
ncbi:MAG: hypothetical protein IT379_23955 [Deltaproteobacteria bacterium]|nr:hypothetical protein [Deltaproteobacteria bacterium]